MGNRQSRSTTSAAVRASSVTAKASGAETVSTIGPPVDMGDSYTVSVTVTVTAASGTTPTLVVIVEGSTDGVTWFQLGTMGAANAYQAGAPSAGAPANITGADSCKAAFTAPQFVRTRSVIGGTTPSFTYSVVVEPS